MKNALQIVKASIEVGRCELIDCGYFFDIRLNGILPGCKKAVTLHHSTMIGYLWLKPLFGHSGEAHISPAAWRKLMATIPVVVKPFDNDVTMTPELEKMAREYAAKFATMAEEGQAKADYKSNWQCDAIITAQQAA